jgi:hypothetical protein
MDRAREHGESTSAPQFQQDSLVVDIEKFLGRFAERKVGSEQPVALRLASAAKDPPSRWQQDGSSLAGLCCVEVEVYEVVGWCPGVDCNVLRDPRGEVLLDRIEVHPDVLPVRMVRPLASRG